jgi:hypothetical protein
VALFPYEAYVALLIMKHLAKPELPERAALESTNIGYFQAPLF